jgi:hypothetical protein
MTVFQGQKFPYGVYNSLLSNHYISAEIQSVYFRTYVMKILTQFAL